MNPRFSITQSRLIRFTPLFIFLLFIILGLLFKIVFVEPERKSTEKQVITSDGIWYYSYLPATLIYHDLSFGFLPEVYKKNYPNDGFIPYPYYHNGKPLNKFFCGVAILQAPFFLTAHSLSHIFGYPPDGFSFIYQLFIWVAAVFYCVAGCAFLLKILTSYGISDRVSIFSVLLVSFGTNLFYYVFHASGMSHVYSFFAVSAFFYFVRHFFLHQNRRSFIFACIAFALILLIRPVNALVIVLLPLLGEKRKIFGLLFWQ